MVCSTVMNDLNVVFQSMAQFTPKQSAVYITLDIKWCIVWKKFMRMQSEKLIYLKVQFKSAKVIST